MYLQLRDYHMANEILYVLDAAKRRGSGITSKLSLQKMLFLSGALSPIKEIILTFMKYITYYRGPYSKDIQNTIDHLVAAGLVDLASYSHSPNGKELYANYIITTGGLEAIDSLCRYPCEEEKRWWISIICKLSQIYIRSEDLSGTEDERIMMLVYQEPSYKTLRLENKQKYTIDLEITRKLISFLKAYTKTGSVGTTNQMLRGDAEKILITFFEYLYLNYVNEHCHG